MHKTWDHVLSEIRQTQINTGCIQFYVEPTFDNMTYQKVKYLEWNEMS